ncbi:MAG: NYN domain-containing protein [Clostridiales bacterium]|nr:NYN domain-containing protein [Clostridiales bacterium]
MPEPIELRLAVLIDADNAPRTAMKEIMEEIAVYGSPTIKRIYGDWTTPNMASWKAMLLEYAITPIQQYAYTTGKNATDSAMIIDAMDILYSGRVDGFVLVSSDSDFTRLATRLREAGMKVYGMGEKKTPQPFIASCDKFVYIEVIRAAAKEAEPEQDHRTGQKANKRKPAAQNNRSISPVTADIIELIALSLEDITDDEGYGMLSALGTLLLKKRPDFDSRNYGFKKLSSMIQSIPRFEVQKQGTTTYIRDLQAK